jgi:predicted DNA-binding transcriptional regulator AlpA
MTAVTTQSELDAALARGDAEIIVDSPSGVWLTVTGDGSSSVEAWGSSRVVAWGSSRVVARGSSSVEAWGSSRVVARGSSRVVAWDSSSVEAWGSSRVVARGSSSVEARGSSSVEAWGSSRVVAWDSSSVEAWGSSRVEAWDSSSVEAWGSSRVEAWGSSRVVAAKYVAVHLHSQRVNLTGGVVIDMTTLDHSDPQTWVDLHGGKVSRGRLTVYKGVNADLISAHGTTYPIGKTVTCDDWKSTADCGNGLHFSPSPISTESYRTPVRYLECTVLLSEIVPLGDKIKAPRCKVVREVDRFGDPIKVASA